MPLFLTNQVFFKLLSHADWLTHGIFWMLIVMSIACWYIFILKFYTLHTKIAQAQAFRSRLQGTFTLEELMHLGTSSHKTPLGHLIAAALGAFRKINKWGEEQHKTVTTTSSQELVSLYIDQAYHEIVKQFEKDIPILKVSAEAGPLIGLFGTVWGLIHAFNRISDQQTADIPTVAPGIAEALLITLTGLFVAIPAMVLYAILSSRLRVLQDELKNSADRIEWIVQSALRAHDHSWGITHEAYRPHNLQQQ